MRLSASSGVFVHRPEAPVPQNTGVSAIDHDVDLVVARSAEANLREMVARQEAKKRLMERHQTSGFHLARAPTGETNSQGHSIDDYWVMPEAEKRATDAARRMGQEAARQIHHDAQRLREAAQSR